MSKQAEKALKEMLDISTDIEKAVVYAEGEVLAGNFPADIQADMVAKARELTDLGRDRAQDMGAGELSQLMVETEQGAVFLVRETGEGDLGVLATGKKDSRVGLVFYDMKTCMRDTREEGQEATDEDEGEEAVQE